MSFMPIIKFEPTSESLDFRKPAQFFYLVIITFCSASAHSTLAPSSSEIKRTGVYVRSFSINAGESSVISLSFTIAVSAPMVIRIVISSPVLRCLPFIVQAVYLRSIQLPLRDFPQQTVPEALFCHSRFSAQHHLLLLFRIPVRKHRRL